MQFAADSDWKFILIVLHGRSSRLLKDRNGSILHEYADDGLCMQGHDSTDRPDEVMMMIILIYLLICIYLQFY